MGKKKRFFFKSCSVCTKKLHNISFILFFWGGSQNSLFFGLAVLVILVIIVKGVCSRLLSLLLLNEPHFSRLFNSFSFLLAFLVFLLLLILFKIAISSFTLNFQSTFYHFFVGKASLSSISSVTNKPFLSMHCNIYSEVSIKHPVLLNDLV